MQLKKFIKWFGIITASFLILLLLAGFVIGWYYNSFKSEYPSGGILSENEQNYDVIFYNINLLVDLDNEAISGNTTVKIKSLTNKLDIIELDLIDLYKVDSVTINNQNAKFRHVAHKLLITPSNPILKSDILDINVSYAGQPPEAKYPPWLGGFTWAEDDSGNAWVGLSCQGEGAKIWIPCKDHPTDEPDSVAVNITVPGEYFVASNGILRSVTKNGNGLETFHWITHYPINNYLINFGIGKFIEVKDTYIAEDSTRIPVVFYVLPQLLFGANHFVAEVKDALHSYSKYFGEFPWKNEKCGFLNTPFSGMEHQTLIAYGNDYRTTHVDSFTFDPLLVHELAHEWWGNEVTIHDWADFWIQEGITTYAEALYVLDKAGEQAYHDYMMKNNERILNNRPLISEPNSNSSDAYHSDIYNKGAAFMHTLRYVLGDSVFFPTLKEFATDSSYILQNKVDTEDFLDLVNKNSGNDLSELFHLYLNTTKLPQISIDSVAFDTYEICIPNINFKTPMDVSYNHIIQRMLLGPDTIQVKSSDWPVVDKNDWYLKDGDI